MARCRRSRAREANFLSKHTSSCVSSSRRALSRKHLLPKTSPCFSKQLQFFSTTLTRTCCKRCRSARPCAPRNFSLQTWLIYFGRFQRWVCTWIAIFLLHWHSGFTPPSIRRTLPRKPLLARRASTSCGASPVCSTSGSWGSFMHYVPRFTTIRSCSCPWMLDWSCGVSRH